MRKMFSENQIKSIVNQGIESGDVQVGTKLYKHTIEVETNDSWLTINCITNNATIDTEYTIISFGDSIDENSGTHIYVLSLSIVSNTLEATYLDSDGAIQSIVNETITEINDQAIPL